MTTPDCARCPVLCGERARLDELEEQRGVYEGYVSLEMDNTVDEVMMAIALTPDGVILEGANDAAKRMRMEIAAKLFELDDAIETSGALMTDVARGCVSGIVRAATITDGRQFIFTGCGSRVVPNRDSVEQEPVGLVRNRLSSY